MGQMEMKCIFDIGKIFLYVPRLAMWPMGLLFTLADVPVTKRDLIF
jgi:hypothetical protein